MVRKIARDGGDATAAANKFTGGREYQRKHAGIGYALLNLNQRLQWQSLFQLHLLTEIQQMASPQVNS